VVSLEAGFMTVEVASSLERSKSDRKVAVGALASSMVNIVKVALQLLLLPVMARLLGPVEFGLYSLALPLVSLVALLADGGLGATLAREQESTSLIWSSAFWALLVTGTTLAVFAVIFGIFLGQLTHQPRLASMIALLSLSLVFLALSVIPSARLARRKNLGTGAAADLASTVAGAAIAVIMALNGGGAWSLAAQYVVTYAVRAILLNLAAFELPGLQFSFSALRPHLISGGLMIGSRIFDSLGRIGENFFINRAFGITVLGNYTFGNQISKFATEAMGNVTWAALYVQALTIDKSKVVILHRRLCRLLGITLFPATFIAAAAAPELVNLTLGPAWVDLSFILRIFLPLFAFATICSQSSPILLAYGRLDIYFWCLVGASSGRVLVVFLGIWVGLTATLYGLALVTLLFCAAILIVPSRPTGCRPGPMLRGLVRPALSAAVAAFVYLEMISASPAGLAWTFASLGCSSLAYVALLFLIDRKDLNEDWTTVHRLFFPKNKTGDVK
jgi:O-antigen/teichoic acid export membrane protein